MVGVRVSENKLSSSDLLVWEDNVRLFCTELVTLGRFFVKTCKGQFSPSSALVFG